MPEELRLLLNSALRVKEVNLPDDGSYAWADKYLLQLMQDRIDSRRQLGELRRGRS
jgi:hypothetical protein